MVGGDGQVTGHLHFVAPAGCNPVEPGDGGLAAVPESIDGSLELAHVLPVVVGPLGVDAGVLLYVASGAEGFLAGSGEHENPH